MKPDNFEQKAIQAALTQNWETAINFNQVILEENPKNVAALNRLAKAYWELGDLNEARSIYQRVLRLDRFNPVAQKNLTRLAKSATPHRSKSLTINFLEEPGKTKSVSLLRLGNPTTIDSITAGEMVKLQIKRRRLAIFTQENEYVGSLPDNISFLLHKMILSGNRYEAVVKSTSFHEVVVFIKEAHRAKRFGNTPSFPSSKESL